MSAVITPSNSRSPVSGSPLVRSTEIPHDLHAQIVFVVPWRDDVIEATGHDPRSQYVERFWLSILGPSTTWFLRSLAWGLDGSPDGFHVSFADMAQAMGLGARVGRHSPFMKAVQRATQFELIAIQQQPADHTIVCARRKVPWLSRRMTAALPLALQEEHRLWVEASTSTRKRAQH